jgi:branched-chain amino acid transport system permease protein
MHELVYVVTLGSVYLIFALGLSITWGTIDVLNFAHGSIFMFSAFGVHQLLDNVDMGMPLMLITGAAIGAGLSGIAHLVAFEPLRARAHPRERDMQILIVGIGLAAVPVALVERSTGGNPFGLGGGKVDVTSFHLGPVAVTNVQVIICIVALVLTTAVGMWLRSSQHGLALRAIGVDDRTTALMGVNRGRLAFLTMAGSGASAGIAGVLLTLNYGALSPMTGDFLMLKAFAVIIIGGVGSVAGVAAGSFLLAIAETAVLTWTSGTWVDAISFAMILLILLVRPQGLFGRRAVVKT